MRTLAAILLPILLASPVYGKGEFVYFGLGHSTCGQFADLYRRAPATIEQGYYSWAQGFMSALNMSDMAAHKTYYRDLHSMSVEDQEAQLRSYCDQHPLEQYIQAVMYLYGELKAAKFEAAQ